MLTVKYKKYYNDFLNKQEIKRFFSLKELEDWLFDMVPGSYDSFRIFFINPDDKWVKMSDLDNSCISSSDGRYHYWVEQIEEDGKIIYSCGTFTNGQKYWNDKIKDWLRHCDKRRRNPQFNFG